MGRRGPGRTPDNVKVFRGTWRADRALNTAQPEQARRTPPRWLTNEDARAIYRRIAKVLAPARLATVTDVEALANLANLSALQQRLFASAADPLVTGSQGQPVANPIYDQIVKLQDRIEKLYRSFGMTPSARASIEIPGEEKPSDPMAELLEGKG